jgi:EpsI family protein
MDKKVTSPSRINYPVIALLVAAMLLVYAVPRPKYRSQDILTGLNIPSKMDYWRGMDVSNQLNIRDQRYNFVGQVFARNYRTDLGDSLLCLILDVSNFHPPANCYKSSGFEILDQKGLTVELPNVSIARSVSSFYADKGNEGVFVVYWTCMNKKITDNWLTAELSQLWANLTGKERTGLMVRLDIPAERGQLENARQTARDFIRKLYSNTPPEKRGFVFGE